MNNNICPECKTENEPGYGYCKNCGTPLFANNTASGQNSGGGFYAPDENGGKAQPQPELIDGNTIEEVITFVGKNPQKIVPKFVKLQATASKTGWCWPPFILGFLFGPVGTAIWFLYRKMYSFAALFGAIGIAANYILRVLNYFWQIGTVNADPINNYFEGLAGGVFDYEGFISALTDSKAILSYFVNSAYSALGIACGVVAGVFGIYLYKRHAAKVIGYVKATVTDVNYTKIAISSKGGTSVGAVIVGIILISLLINLPDMIYGILKAMKVVYVL